MNDWISNEQARLVSMQQQKKDRTMREQTYINLRSRMWHDVIDHARPIAERIGSAPEFRRALGPIKYEEPNVCSFKVTKDCFPNAIFMTVTERHDGLRVERHVFRDVPDTRGRSESEDIEFINVNGDGHFRTREGTVMNLPETIQYLFLPIVRAV
jgi:hypothetical protein